MQLTNSFFFCLACIYLCSDAHLGNICSDWYLFAFVACLGDYRPVQHLHMQSFEEWVGASVVSSVHQWVSFVRKKITIFKQISLKLTHLHANADVMRM